MFRENARTSLRSKEKKILSWNMDSAKMAINKAIQVIRFKSKLRPDGETILDYINKNYKAFMNEVFEVIVNDRLIEDRGENETESSFL